MTSDLAVSSGYSCEALAQLSVIFAWQQSKSSPTFESQRNMRPFLSEALDPKPSTRRFELARISE